jgi:trans-aconitate methyltransferase
MSMKTTDVHIVTETLGQFEGTGPGHGEYGGLSQGRGFAQYAANISSMDHSQAKNINAKMSSSDAAAWAYTKCAMLFFAALIITWVSIHSETPIPRCFG